MPPFRSILKNVISQELRGNFFKYATNFPPGLKDGGQRSRPPFNFILQTVDSNTRINRFDFAGQDYRGHNSRIQMFNKIM